MKYNINVTKSIWRRLRKPKRAALDAIYSENAVYTEAFSEAAISADQVDHTVAGNLSKGGGWIWPRPGRGFFASERSLLTHIAATQSVCALPVASK